jgi:hypothetical protein
MIDTSFKKQTIYGIRFIVQGQFPRMWIFLSEKRCDEKIKDLHTRHHGITSAEKVVFVIDEQQTKVVK